MRSIRFSPVNKRVHKVNIPFRVNIDDGEIDLPRAAQVTVDLLFKEPTGVVFSPSPDLPPTGTLSGKWCEIADRLEWITPTKVGTYYLVLAARIDIAIPPSTPQKVTVMYETPRIKVT